MGKSKLFFDVLPARVRWKENKPPAATGHDALGCLDLSDPAHEAWLEHAAAHTFRAVCWATTYSADTRDRMAAEYANYMLNIPTWPAAVGKTLENIPPMHYSQMALEAMHKSHIYVTKPAVSAAAIYIQAAWRGHAARRRLADPTDPLCRKRLMAEFDGMTNKRQKLEG